MASSAALPTVSEPFPIFKLAQKYLIYDADTAAHARREYNICGVLMGSLPQAPQQNVFLGLPLELMPEEARLLVEKGVAHIVDDVVSHKGAFLANGLGAEERRSYQAALRKQGVGAAMERTKRGDDRKKAALAKKAGAENWNDIPDDMLAPPRERKRGKSPAARKPHGNGGMESEEESLFAPPPDSLPSAPSTGPSTGTATPEPEPFMITPATSYPPLQASAPPANGSDSATEALPSYPLFRHLHDKGYFLSPGLRFGCQFVAYPGDPLRFHSHFLCNGMDWDQEFDLLDLVGGGRLGTGVKKGFLIGGSTGDDAAGRGDDPRGEVRSFCIEWGGL